MSEQKKWSDEEVIGILGDYLSHISKHVTTWGYRYEVKEPSTFIAGYSKETRIFPRPPFEASEGGSVMWDVELTYIGHSKLNVIKCFKLETGLGLKESKDIIESLGVIKSGIPWEEAQKLSRLLTEAGATVEVSETKNTSGLLHKNPFGSITSNTDSSQWDVKLIHGGPNKFSVVKLVKDQTGLGLREAKNVVDNNAHIIYSVPYERAKEIADLLEEAGAKVEIKNSRK